jgi:AbrB family looped-hinge helix DNA binding protein
MRLKVRLHWIYLRYNASKEFLTYKEIIMTAVIDMAKVTAKGQITIPADVREAVGIHAGDKVLFVRMDDGSVALRSSNLDALRQAQNAFAGAADEAGLSNEDDLNALIGSVRAERARRQG